MDSKASSTGDRPALGIILILVATFLFIIQDTMTKSISTEYAVPLILMVRFWISMVYALVYMRIKGRSLKRCFESKRPVLQLTRSAVLVLEIGVFVLAIRTLSLAEIHSLFATYPLMITALSVPLLGETVGIRRWLAVCIGFVGVLVILRPGLGVFDAGAVYALACAALFALYQVLTRKVAKDDPSDTSFFYFMLVGFVTTSLIGPFYWEPIDAEGWMTLLGIGLTSSFSHLLLILALQHAAASVLQPFNYMPLVWAVLVGYVVFGDLPDLWTIVGAVVIVGSGLYTFYRQHVRKRKPAVVVTPRA